jgi:hypothetical protein
VEVNINRLKLKGYRFIVRIGLNHVILASTDDSNYMLFTEVQAGVDEGRDVTIRNRWYRYQKALTQGTEPMMYLEARQADEERNKNTRVST